MNHSSHKLTFSSILLNLCKEYSEVTVRASTVLVAVAYFYLFLAFCTDTNYIFLFSNKLAY